MRVGDWFGMPGRRVVVPGIRCSGGRYIGISIVTTAEPVTIVTRRQRAPNCTVMPTMIHLLSARGVMCFRDHLIAASLKPREQERGPGRGETRRALRAAGRRQSAGGHSRDGISYKDKDLISCDRGMFAIAAVETEGRSQACSQVIDSRILGARALSAIN